MTHDFRIRSPLPEMMDDESLTRDEFEACLRSLTRVNIATLAYRPTLHWLGCLPEQSWSILDVGSGGGDMLRRIWRWGKRRGMGFDLTGIDLNPWSKTLADARIPPGAGMRFETADLFALPKEQTSDLIISSLFTHHLPHADLVRFLVWMEQHATRGWFINDLHRHAVPYHFIRLATALLRMNRIVRNDAPISVARSFRRKEWEALLREAGIPLSQVRIRWYFPFRYCVERHKP